ncbi:MAG: hypothetical protein WAU53_07735 [Rhodoplanes sp.]
MPNQSAAANVHPITRIAPAPQLPAPSDPVPAMRREMKLLRIELERLQAMQKFLLAHIDCLMANRDEWQREAERLSDLLAQAPGSTHEANFFKPPWLLFWWRRNKSPCEAT